VNDSGTPLSGDELADLIPDLTTQEELNEWERQNILEADAWALDSASSNSRDPLTEPYVRELHRRMFDQTWKWAGRYRKTGKNIGVGAHQIREEVAKLLLDVAYWVQNRTYDPDEIAVRFHHRLVWVHPFPNGNGRHARLMADVLLLRVGRDRFTWGSLSLAPTGDLRSKYIGALRETDGGDVGALLAFARS
jgi:Fic-DOC domain mobile mystery protein B